MKPELIVATEAAHESFYPTPPDLAHKMIGNIDLRYVESVLEPSAGTGNLIRALAEVRNVRYYDNKGLDIDCCEIDPYLRQALKYEFSEEKKSELYAELEPLRNIYTPDMTQQQKTEKNRLENEIYVLNQVAVHVVHDDFLTYRSHKRYSLILMNPPFADGDRHLLHAIELQERGGSIICLLNAETLRNPYTATRQLLTRKLEQLGAEIEYIEHGFKSAERQTDVEVALVRLHIEAEREESDIYNRMKKAVDEEAYIPDPEIQALAPGDYLEQAVRMYRVEVDATMELIRQYKALVPYIGSEINPDGKYGSSPMLNLVVERDSAYGSLDVNKYMRLVRLKYWRALMKNEKFTGKLTSTLKEKYRQDVERMANYEFSLFNIKQILFDMNAHMKSGIEEAIVELFDKLTVEHSWYPECQQNRHYFNGWATNKAHKIGKKCIIPTYGMFSSYSWERNTFSENTAYEVINDIERVLDYLNASPSDDGYNLRARLSWANNSGQTRNIELKYFKIDLFKKGTTHIKFLPEAMPIVERLNIYAAQHKKWLPPNYGKSPYSNMAADERAVVDSFHGDDSEGSGEAAYTKVLQNASFYLAEPTQKLPALMAP